MGEIPIGTTKCTKYKQNANTTYTDCVSTNTITRYTIYNTHDFKVPDRTEQYKSSFVIRTVADWKLEDQVVTADCHCIFHQQ